MKRRILILVVVAATIIISMINYNSHRENMQKSIASKILRFHVLANSDESSDQEVKKKVRDAVGSYIEPLLENSKSIEETREIVQANLDNINQVAEQTLEDNGFDYGASSVVTYTQFPEKTYGSYTFPSGEYEALEINLGRAEGHNWWCVLYPNMCFRGSVYEVVDSDCDKALRQVLTEEEYREVFDSGKFEISFKILELF